MTDNEKIAELLFSDINKTPNDYEKMYPERNLKEGARVTRFAPSPTGFLHLGGLFGATVDKLTAKSTGGIFILRIEDTDKKREIDGGINAIIEGLKAFDTMPTEGVMGENEEIGDYGPYVQSKRKDIYRCYAKDLVIKGLAYPCFCTPQELDEIREKQEAEGVNKGYYQKWAKCRDLTYAEIKANIDLGKSYVLRLKSFGDETKKCFFDDIIRGKIEMPENVQDVVILKTDGIPPYAFAHCVDDHLMRTTHIIRGDEWIASTPVHLQLFKACGFKAPKYAHTAAVMKEENGGKRKLSKRKDPEAAVTYFSEVGYPSECVIEYLMTLANSNFEDWRKTNKTASSEDFQFNLKKMSVSGALFDLVKLNDISKNMISVMTADEVYERTLNWANEYDKSYAKILISDEANAKRMMNLDRETKNPRKDIAKWSEVLDYFSYFYNDYYKRDYTLPENIKKEDAIAILKEYLKVYSENDEKDIWFNKIKDLCEGLGFTPNVKEYKQNPEAFKGHVGDVSTVIRIAVTSRTNTPDLCTIMKILGGQEVINRINDAIKNYKEEN
ncbi:MAG: glutamate--tRNA ligase [Oscillospiraceae bacterium]